MKKVYFLMVLVYALMFIIFISFSSCSKQESKNIVYKDYTEEELLLFESQVELQCLEE